MFKFLVRYLPERVATIALGVWYAILLWALFLSAHASMIVQNVV